MVCRRIYDGQASRKESYLSLAVFVFLLCLALRPVSLAAQPTVQQLIEKGDSCRHDWKYNHALAYFHQAYNDHSVAKSPDLQMQLLVRIMRCHHVLRHWKEMSEVSYRLYDLARKYDNNAYLSMALFMRGKHYHMEGHKDKGYQICLEAMDLMKATDYRYKYHELAASCAILTKMYVDDKRFNEALRMSDEQLSYVNQAYKTNTNCDRGLQRYQAVRMQLLAEVGRYAEADSLYRAYGDMPTTDPLCGDALLRYFLLRNMPEKAVAFIEAAIRNIREDGDSIGRNMQRLYGDQGKAYYSLGQYQKAADCYANMSRITDSISAHTLHSIATEVNKVKEKEHAIARHRLVQIITAAAILLLLTFVAFLIRQGLMERRKNRSMMNTIQQLLRYRDQVIQNGDPVEMDENEAESAPEDEQYSFKQVDKRIMKERLFAQPDFGRDELMRLLGVDKNSLPSIIQRYAGTNVPGYVNNKRMEYAVLLIKQHPEYTLGAISEACGIKSPATFIRNFKSTYGMTPSEYRKQLDESEITPPILTYNNTKTP